MLVLLPAAALLAWYLALRSRGLDRARAFLWTAVGAQSLVWASTEALSLFGLLGGPGVAAAWAAAFAGGFFALRKTALPQRPDSSPWRVVAAAALAFPIVGSFLSAVFGPPNMVDAANYHMPRVLYWLQAGSVRFYPTGYYQQLSLQPLMEYGMAHLYALGGGDRFVQLVQWAAFLGSIGAAAIVARRLGAGPRGGWMAALFLALLPMAALQASGAKPDIGVAFWFLAAVAFALEARDGAWLRSSALGAGLALGFALASKGTAYAMAPGLAAGLLLGAEPAVRRSWLRALPAFAAAALLVNAPHYYRNWRLNGYPLGTGTAHEGSALRYANDRIGPGTLASNALRNASLQLVFRPSWNAAIYSAVLEAHEALGLDPNARATTWADTQFKPAHVSNHEGVAPNVRHTLLLGLAGLWLLWRRKLDLTAGLFLGALAGFAAFCLLIKWQPWHARMHLPLFATVCPVLALWAEQALPRWLAVGGLAWLFVNLRPAILHNALRPLGTERSVLTTERFRQYFVDLPALETPFRLGAHLVVRSGCRRVGIDASSARQEYPLLARIRELAPETQFRHVGVANSSARYEDRAPFTEPCAVLCSGCGGIPEKRNEYAQVGSPVLIGDLLVFVRR